MEGNWPMSPTNIMDKPPNGRVKRPVASLQRLLIQANIFWPITENSSIIKYLIPFKSVCSFAKADDFNGPFLFPCIGSWRSECKVVPFMLNAAIPKKAHTVHFSFSRVLTASITKLFPEPPKPVIIIRS